MPTFSHVFTKQSRPNLSNLPSVEITVFSLCIMHNILSILFPPFTFSNIFSEIWWNWIKNVKWCLISNLHNAVMNFPILISYSLFMHPNNFIYIWFILTILFTIYAVYWIATVIRCGITFIFWFSGFFQRIQECVSSSDFLHGHYKAIVNNNFHSWLFF